MILKLSTRMRVAGVPWEAVAVAALLIAGLLLRLPSLDAPSVEQRENQSSLLARGWFHGDGDDLPAWKRQVLDDVDTVLKPFEPPLLELAAATFYRATGDERVWFPRLLSVFAWIIGGALLAVIARRVTNRVGMLTAVAIYLAWPYAAWHSRKFMPDALLVACLLAAVLTIVRYWERPSRTRFLTAATAAAVATAIKPGVGFLFVVALFVALALAQGRFRDETRSGRLFLFAGIAASLALAYVVIGRYATDFVNPDAAAGRFTPDYLVTREFWTGWWHMVSYLLRFPQPQELLAVVPLAVGSLGLLLAPKGVPRAILWGLAAGYATFALAVANYTATHPYYALPLIPILALAIGLVVGRLHARLSGIHLAQAAVVALVAAVAAGGGLKTYATLSEPAPLETVADYRRIGDLTEHTTRAIVADDRLAHPIMYWGWIVAEAWALDDNDALPPWIDPEEKDYLIVVGNHQLAHAGLRAFTRDRPVAARSDRYTIFDLRGDLLESAG